MDDVLCITSWSDIGNLEPHTLVVLDIDETFLWFPTVNKVWWDDLLETLSAEHPPDRVQSLARDEWLRVVNQENPVQTDMDGFRLLNQSIKRTDSRLIFLTARLESFSYLTRKHLNYCGVSQDTVIHYSSSKGQSLRAIVARYPNCGKVIFVDDKVENIEDVRRHNPSVQTYRWVISAEKGLPPTSECRDAPAALLREGRVA
jgi:hypothetical protein